MKLMIQTRMVALRGRTMGQDAEIKRMRSPQKTWIESAFIAKANLIFT